MEFNTKAVNSTIGSAIGRKLKENTISTGTNVLTDIVAGKNSNEGIDREVGK